MKIFSIEKQILVDVINNPGDTFYENVLSDFLDEQGIEHDFRKLLHNNKIIELKPYQEKCLDIWANYWINIGLCTNPTDEKKAEQYLSDFYKELGFPNPKSIIWFDNPIEMCSRIWFDNPIEMCSRLSNWDHGLNQVWDRIWSQIRDQVKGQVWNQAWDQICNQVWNQAWNQILCLVRDYICGQIKNNTTNEIGYGQRDVHWFAFYAYMMQVLRVKISKSLVYCMFLTQEVYWWFPTEKNIYATRKPKECIVENNKLVKITFQDNYTIN
jgi:hypothetical protein